MPDVKKKNWLLYLLVAVVAGNLSWEHQTILIQMVDIDHYYRLAVPGPFVYRILPALVYRAVMGGHPELLTGMNAPFNSSASIFQLILDSVSLVVTLVFMQKIARRLNPQLQPAFLLVFAAAAQLVIVVFGYYMVPNRALFYPYDFPDMAFATVVFYLCIRLEGRAEYWLPLGIFVATFNKETAIFYSGLYLALRAGRGAAWRRVTTVLAACAIAFLLARNLVAHIADSVASPPVAGAHLQYEVHIGYTLEQFRNPLFVFAMLNICSYLYLAVYLLRRRLDRTDLLILLMVAGWCAIMAVVGVVRELRIFVPASLMMFVIISRHLQPVVQSWLPRAATPEPQP